MQLILHRFDSRFSVLLWSQLSAVKSVEYGFSEAGEVCRAAAARNPFAAVAVAGLPLVAARAPRVRTLVPALTLQHCTAGAAVPAGGVVAVLRGAGTGPRLGTFVHVLAGLLALSRAVPGRAAALIAAHSVGALATADRRHCQAFVHVLPPNSQPSPPS